MPRIQNGPPAPPSSSSNTAAPTTATGPSSTTATATAAGDLPAAAGERPGAVTDTFDGTRTDGDQRPGERKQQAATEQFSARVDDILNRDALSLSRGERPFQGGDRLSEGQMSELKDAAKDYLMDVPLASFSPQVKAGVGALLDRAGVKPADLDSMSLHDVQRHVGGAASEYAQGLVDGLKDKAPAAYYGLLAVGAAGAGALAYTKGSDALRRLGVKPELKLGVFDKHLELRVGADWDARFRNFTPSVGVRGQIGDERFSLRGDVEANRNGITDVRLDGTWQIGPRTSLLGSAEYRSVRSLREPSPDLSLAGFDGDRLRASVSLLHQPSANTSFAITGSYDNATGPWVGLGFTARF